MIDDFDEQQFRDRIGRLEALLVQIEQLAHPDVQDKCREAVQTLLEFHAVGLQRIVETVAANGAAGEALLDELARDEVVGSMLVLHNLHPHDLQTRVAAALERVRPLLASHGGNVELLDVSADGAVRLKLLGSCHGCPSSQATLKNAIEEAIYATAGDVTAIHVEGVAVEQNHPPAAAFVPLGQLAGHRRELSSAHSQPGEFV
jgi:Fe-S cluster biogenesis protein NfuA